MGGSIRIGGNLQPLQLSHGCGEEGVSVTSISQPSLTVKSQGLLELENAFTMKTFDLKESKKIHDSVQQI